MKSYKKILFFSVVNFALFLFNLSGANHFFISDNSISDNLFVQMLMQLQDYSNKYTQSDTFYNNSNMLLNIINYLYFL